MTPSTTNAAARELLAALDDAIRQLKPGTDVQGGAEEYGFSRAKDMAAKLVRKKAADIATLTQQQGGEQEAGEAVACAMSADAAAHVAFIEVCADMLHKFNRTFTARTLRGTAKWVEANTTPPRHPADEGRDAEMTATDFALLLVARCLDTNSERAEFRLEGVTDAGKDAGDWVVMVSPAPPKQEPRHD